MVQISGIEFGKLLFLKLERGDDLLECIRKAADDNGISHSVVLSGAATLERASFHRVRNCDQIPQNEYLELEAAFEVSSLQGVILNGEPHIHMTFSSPDDRCFAQHLESGSRVLYTAEILIAEIKGMEHVKREYSKTGIPVIVTK